MVPETSTLVRFNSSKSNSSRPGLRDTGFDDRHEKIAEGRRSNFVGPSRWLFL